MPNVAVQRPLSNVEVDRFPAQRQSLASQVSGSRFYVCTYCEAVYLRCLNVDVRLGYLPDLRSSRRPVDLRAVPERDRPARGDVGNAQSHPSTTRPRAHSTPAAATRTAQCPASCLGHTAPPQREITESEFSLLPAAARQAVHQSRGQCLLCTRCGNVYIREGGTSRSLGRVRSGLTGLHWVPEEPLRRGESTEIVATHS